MFHILDVPPADVATVKQGAANRLLFMFGRPSDTEQVDIASGMASFWRYCEELAEDRRASAGAAVRLRADHRRSGPRQLYVEWE